jgi:hypothetical protein
MKKGTGPFLKFQDPRNKFQANPNIQKNKSQTDIWRLDYWFLEIAWILVFGSWNLSAADC